jgi:hypothetical protein
MVKKILSLALLFILLSVNGVYCQKIFRDGYIIKKNGETMNGLIEYSVNQGTPKVCIFKRFDIAMPVEYGPADIQGFAYRNGNRYESREYDSKESFFEVLVSGQIVLYGKGSKSYIDKDHSGLVELKSGSIKYSNKGVISEFKTLPEFLGYLTEGKVEIPDKINMRFDIIPLIASYNRKIGGSSVVYNRIMSEKALSQIQLVSGVGKNKFGVLAGINIYMLNLKSIKGNYVPGPATEVSPITGLSYERIISGKTDKFSIRLDILYFKQTFYAYSEFTDFRGLVRNDAFYDFTGVKIPLLFQYSMTGMKFVPFVNGGVVYEQFVKHNFQHIAEVENSQHEVSTYEYNDFKFKKWESNLVCGLGVKTRLLNNISVSLQGRVEYGHGLFISSSLNLTDFKQNSIQTTFLLGVTF